MANNNQVNQTVENDDMAYASMAALQQQEELERDAYNRGDMNAAYSADTYQDAINLPADKMQNPTAMTLENPSETMPNNNVTANKDATKDVSSENTKDVTTEKKYNNIFASMFHKVATVFGPDSAIGAKFEEVANQLEDRYGTDAHVVQQEAMEARMQRGNGSITTDASNVKTTSAKSETQDVKSKSEDYIPTAEKQSLRDEQLKASNKHMKESADLAVSDDDFLSMKDAKDS